MSNAKITALDYSNDMLKQAHERFSALSIEYVNCINGSILQLPCEQECYDIVLSMNGFHVFPQKGRAFSEVHRVLRKGGEFIGCFYVKGENQRSDFIVNNLLSRKGWFNAPFYTKDEVIKILKRDYSEVHVVSREAMILFRCIK